ncbi:MAG: glycosyltransferase [Myxococcales bacterium]|nr:glycosyltransferase [Myxococcales bacterium]
MRRWQDLCSIRALGHDVHVVVCDPSNEPTPELHQVASSVTVIRSESMLPGSPRWLLSRVFNPTSLALAYPDLRGLRKSVSSAVQEFGIGPDLIWAEEAFAVLLSPHGPPIVHSHLDFHFKLHSVRGRSFASNRLRRPQALTIKRLEKVEVDACRRSAHTMCASRSEADFLRDLGISASYLPVAGPTTPEPDYRKLSEGRLFLFGNPNTAMRAARHDLRTRVWPELEQRKLALQWHQLGKIPREGGDPSWAWLEEHFVIHGFVENLEDVFLPGDASVMPYPFDTGGRAKFAVSAGYGIVNIAYEKTFECSDEFTHGVNCLAARDPAHFAELLDEFVSDDALRLRLAKGSRAVYERHFTMEALYPEYERILDIAMRTNAGVVPCAS